MEGAGSVFLKMPGWSVQSCSLFWNCVTLSWAGCHMSPRTEKGKGLFPSIACCFVGIGLEFTGRPNPCGSTVRKGSVPQLYHKILRDALQSGNWNPQEVISDSAWLAVRLSWELSTPRPHDAWEICLLGEIQSRKEKREGRNACKGSVCCNFTLFSPLYVTSPHMYVHWSNTGRDESHLEVILVHPMAAIFVLWHR